MRYPFSEIESKWQKFWEDNKTYRTDLTKTDKKLYTLVMFIYPSGAKLHIGHWYNYGPTDSWARFKKLQGYNVFEPIGYDAFGLPAEGYAIKTGIHPQDSTLKNIEDIREQLKKMGCMYDWDVELMTCAPEYYKWNQWIFLQMFKRGLAYRKNAPVNWCPKDQTVLANEQVIDGCCERCGTQVIQRNLYQWFFKITDYAEELLEGHNIIDWPDETILKQKNWIGKSEGAEVIFKLADNNDDEIKVFTTRPDTLFGVTYVVLAPEHPLVDKITKPEFKAGVDNYRESTKLLTEIERTSTVKEKTGVPTGAFAINPVNGEKIPVWIADYALITYGTGCVMAVPAHDERDFEFAAKFNLPIRKVILQDGTNEKDEIKSAFTEVGTMISSGKFNGIRSDDGIKQVINYLEENNLGKRKINYRLRDWLISRQRYWGTPIPIIHCTKCGEVPVDENELPVLLPYDVDFKLGGESPLARNEKYINVKCPKCGTDAKRDPDTMDTFVDSSWYYLRFLDPKFSDAPFDKNLADKWTPVDMYVGGKEHSVMHLLYARFFHKFLRDIGLVNSDEPFAKLVHQGVITKDGAKMSKSRGNVVNPNDFIIKYGTDVFRMYLMFMGPYDQGGDWSDKGISGVERFVMRSYELFNEYKNVNNNYPAADNYYLSSLSDNEKKVYRKVNQTLNKFNEEIEHFRFNTAIASLMELINELKILESCSKEIQSYVLLRFASMLAPVAPHLGEECWQLVGNEKSIFEKPIVFAIDKEALIEDTVNIAVQVNGKLRATIEMPLNASAEETGSAAMTDNRVKKFIEGKNIVKGIFVKNKILNIVVKDQIIVNEKVSVEIKPTLTRTEKYVFELAKNSFLSLWSYPIPRGKNNNELCDILIYCEPDIIIISVKEIVPTESGDINIDWQRWKKAALDKSFNQIYGAERYLNSIDQLTLFDGSLGPKLPEPQYRKYHRVAIAIGGEEKMPLLWGDMGKGFIHVFDDKSTSILLKELDTITDFTKYLSKKEEFYTSGNFNKLIFNGGEEDLLAYYFSNSEEFIDKGSLTILDGNLWDDYKKSEAYKTWTKEIIVSLIWDNLIERLIEDFKSNKLEIGAEYENFELVVRKLARESRYDRILLAKAFLDFISSPDIRARPVSSYSGIVYVFMTANRNESREDRRLELAGRCLIVRKNTQNINTVIGIATEKQDGKKGYSIDVVYLYKPTLSDKEKMQADEFVEKYGWFKNSLNKKNS